MIEFEVFNTEDVDKPHMVKSTLSRYLEMESMLVEITHVTHSNDGKMFHHWLKSYGLVDWVVVSPTRLSENTLNAEARELLACWPPACLLDWYDRHAVGGAAARFNLPKYKKGR